MNLLYRILKQDPSNRDGVVTVTSALNIIVNLLIAGVKIIIGTAVASIAIVSEGVNNATDAVTSVLTIVGTKLSTMRPDKKHPFGYGRIEYLTGLIISVLILISGIELLKSSIELIVNPTELAISGVTIAIVAVTAVIKFFMGVYTMRTGRRIESPALTALGLDCRNDSFISVVTIISAIVFLVFHVSVDAYVGVATSVLVLKAGAEVLFETISEILGRPGKKELADKLYREIRSTEGVINAADMMLHNYGPEEYSGSVNIEIDHNRTVGEVYAIIHDLQLRIMHEHNVTMVFGIYAVDNDSPKAVELRRIILEFVRPREHINSIHALYIDEDAKRIYCDFVVDYELRDWEETERQFKDYMKDKYPEYDVELTIETDYV